MGNLAPTIYPISGMLLDLNLYGDVLTKRQQPDQTKLPPLICFENRLQKKCFLLIASSRKEIGENDTLKNGTSSSVKRTAERSKKWMG